MFKKMFSFVIAALLGSCSPVARSPTTYDPPEIRQGVIEQITPVSLPSNHHQGLGAVLGGAAGLGLGSLIGAGRAGTLRWWPARSAAPRRQRSPNHAQPIAGQQIIVRTRSGVLVAVTQPLGPSFQVGQRVYLQGSGENTAWYRITAGARQRPARHGPQRRLGLAARVVVRRFGRLPDRRPSPPRPQPLSRFPPSHLAAH